MSKQPEIVDESDESEELQMPVATAGDQTDQQIVTAHRFPRSLKKFRLDAISAATIDEETAAGCFYTLERTDKKGKKVQITGPSVRLAEICMSCWGNIRCEAGVAETLEKEIVGEAMVWDLEKNNAVKWRTRRRITGSNGRRYSDDMITITGNAAAAIAMRNATFKVVPMVYVKEIERAARAVAIGNADTLGKRRQALVAYFAKMHVDEKALCAYVGRASVDDMTLDDVFALRGVATAIRDGETSIDEQFGGNKAPETADDLKAKMNGASQPEPGSEG